MCYRISPIDGRYYNLTKELTDTFSEYSFIKQRVIIEIKYFLFLLKLNTPTFPNNDKLKLFMTNLSENIHHKHLVLVKDIENQIHHDVKSIEYFLISLSNERNIIAYPLLSQSFCNTQTCIRFIAFLSSSVQYVG